MSKKRKKKNKYNNYNDYSSSKSCTWTRYDKYGNVISTGKGIGGKETREMLSKRRNEIVESFYAVAGGKVSGTIYKNWNNCKKMTDGYPNAKFKKFYNLNEAVQYLVNNGIDIEKIYSDDFDDGRVEEIVKNIKSSKLKQNLNYQKHKDNKNIIEKPIILNNEQEKAMKILESGANCFLTGPAGTGKSTVINEFIKRNKNKGIAKMAPTGIAALNIEGMTIHAAFGFGGDSKITLNKKLMVKIPEWINKTDVIIIDEISMCRIDAFEKIINVIERANKIKDHKIQLIFTGDFYQLPPVITDNEVFEYGKTEKEILIRDFGTNTGYCFESDEWNRLNLTLISLTEVMRQSNKSFVEMLEKVKASSKDAIDWINNNSCKDKISGAINLYPKNAEVDKINEEELNKIPGDIKEYIREDIMNITDKEKRNVAKIVKLKIGARVMAISNDIKERKYANGSLGYVVEMNDDNVIVDFDDCGRCVVDKKEFVFGKPKAEKREIKNDFGQIEIQEVAGEEIIEDFIQIPLKLAYAITIHKSQGQTFNAVNARPGCFEKGQAYTMLSRVKSINKLHLEEEITENDLKTSDKVIEFYRNGGKYTANINLKIKEAYEMLKDWTNLMPECDKEKFNNEIIKMINGEEKESEI